jgi:hypothetical protein
MKTLLDTARKLSEDVALLESDNASLKSQINKLHKKVFQPQGSLFPRVGLHVDTDIADPSKAWRACIFFLGGLGCLACCHSE